MNCGTNEIVPRGWLGSCICIVFHFIVKNLVPDWLVIDEARNESCENLIVIFTKQVYDIISYMQEKYSC